MAVPSPMHTNYSRERDEESDPDSPLQKRRRFDEGSRNYQPQQSPYVDTQRAPMSAFGYPNERVHNRAPLPSPGQLMHEQNQHPQHMGGMEPPPRPSAISPGAPHPFSIQQNGFDESLRLPPLQTQLLGSPPIPYSHAHNENSPAPLRQILSPRQQEQHNQLQRQSRDSALRSVEAMVMTIPYINKIKVLSKISPPLAATGAMNPATEVRGPVIAIEGADPEMLKAVGSWIHEYLGKERECALKTWVCDGEEKGEESEEKLRAEAEKGATGLILRNPGSPGAGDTFVSYLAEIHAWHQKSNEISRFITTPISIPKETPTASNNDNNPATAPISPSTTASGKSPDLPSAAAFEQNAKSTSAEALVELHSAAPQPTPITAPSTANPKGSYSALPVALLPSGFSLTTSDHYASRIPINDAYAPVDHWQWAATLWRGIVGPDLTIYVKGVAPVINGNGLIGGDWNAAEREEREEMIRSGGVEIRGDCKAIIVRSEIGAEGVVEERTLRRLGFEVLEFVRGFGPV